LVSICELCRHPIFNLKTKTLLDIENGWQIKNLLDSRLSSILLLQWSKYIISREIPSHEKCEYITQEALKVKNFLINSTSDGVISLETFKLITFKVSSKFWRKVGAFHKCFFSKTFMLCQNKSSSSKRDPL